ncbi:hypothetical protein H4R35_006818 [Dimargaris xerosporica]|nr:hypothetical protein H4R35_006818 [Dimargaris xerosporica]
MSDAKNMPVEHAPMAMPEPSTSMAAVATPAAEPPPYSPSAHQPAVTEAVTKDAQAFAPPPQAERAPTYVSGGFVTRNQPILATCPKCQLQVTSEIDTKVGTKSGLFALLTCVVCWPLFWIPLCMNSCKDEVHRCPNCKTELGRIPA